ncbi:hypothetical protein B0T19DRAFT_122819 [Cercophora scortea]|uniref:Uncharacterized protein n=1 Tax=Cercophora scortea TaxID=314031 RepID=A0AAE0IY25_9PEZI|nr:hypothetical protein B0T19DRAFT_122819 [Cercophora scortea]
MNPMQIEDCYITDLDCWSILAVVATASKNQAAYLRSFIHRHLAFKNFIGVYMPVTGFSTFALEFHIPFYVWRQREGPILDQRRRANGKPLRWSSNLGFLKLDPSDGPASSVEDCIYEAQISCIVTGIDERSWVGYACIDTYYKGDRDDNQESVEYYVEQSINGPRMDPLSGGRFDADKPIWKPREYFLRLLDCRMDQVRQEWHNVVSRALQTTEEYTHDYLLPADDLSPDHTEKYNKRVQRFSRMTIRFLLQIITLLSKTIGSWDTFKEGDLGHFLGLDPLGSTDRSGSSSRLLLTVEKHVSELRVLRNEVEAQKQLLENLEREVTQDLQQDSNKIASLQQQSGEHMKVFSIIALTFLPISTTAAIFSVNSDILPFQPNLRTFAITTICLGAVVLAVLTLILNWSWYRLIPGCLSSFSQRERRWSSPGSSTLGGSSSNGRFRDDLEMNILP